MTMPALPPPQRKVVLRLSNGDHAVPAPPSLDAGALDSLLARARALGLPLHHDPQIAALLISLRMRQDVPAQLYAAAAAVLSSIYAAATEGGTDPR